MDDLTRRTLQAFEDALEKDAAVGDLLRQAGSYVKGQAGAVGAGAGVGAAAGAALGAAGGGVSSYRDARAQGATRGQAALSGLGGAIGGVSKGALTGAAVGGAAGLAGGARAANLATQVSGRGDLLGGAARVGQRQLHGLTGYMSPEQLRAVGGGSASAQKTYNNVLNQTNRTLGAGATTKELTQAKGALDASRRAEDMGLTSVPGFLKGMAGHATYQGKRVSPLEAIRTGVGEQWHGSGMLGKGLMVAAPAMSVAGAVTGPDRTAEGGRVERAAKGLASGLAYSTPIGLLGQTALGHGMGAAAGAVGRGGDKVIEKLSARRRLNMGLLPNANVGPEADERYADKRPEMIQSNAAQGKPPEDMGV